jgi:hypothetical protein
MPPLSTLIALLSVLAGTLRQRASRGEGGISTLEVAIIVLGLMAVAGALAAAIASAVSNRTAQIK